MSEPATTLEQPPTHEPAATRSTHRLVRWFQERKRAFRDRALAVVATLLVLLIGLGGWCWYSQWRLGRIVLTNHGIPLLVQELPESGDEPLDEPFDLVHRSTLALPAGDYRLRVNGVGRLGRTYRFAVNRGETITYELSLDQGPPAGGRCGPVRTGSASIGRGKSRCPLRS